MIDYKAVKNVKKGDLVGCMWYMDDWCECFEDPVYEINQQKYKYASEIDGGYIKFKTIEDMALFYESLPNVSKGSCFISIDKIVYEEDI